MKLFKKIVVLAMSLVLVTTATESVSASTYLGQYKQAAVVNSASKTATNLGCMCVGGGYRYLIKSNTNSNDANCHKESYLYTYNSSNACVAVSGRITGLGHANSMVYADGWLYVTVTKNEQDSDSSKIWRMTTNGTLNKHIMQNIVEVDILFKH